MNITKISKAKSEIICPSKSILVISANYNAETIYQILLKNPSLVNFKDQKNETFLSYAIKRKKEEICQIIINSPLLDLSYQNSKGNTYLHLSVINQLINTTKLLLKKNIKINSQNNEGNTPLHYAYNFNNIKLISLLVEKNADLNIKNNLGIIPEKIEQNSLNNEINEINSSMNDFCFKSFYKDNNNLLDKNISIQLTNNENTNNTKLNETNKNSFKYSLVNFSYSDDNDEDKNKEKKDELNILDIMPNNNINNINYNTKSEISDIFNITSSITYKEKIKNVSDINSHTIGDRYNNILIEKKEFNSNNNESENNDNNSDDIVNLQKSQKDLTKNKNCENDNDKMKKNYNLNLRSKSDNIFFEYSTSISKEEKELNNNNNNIKSSFNKYIDQDFIFSPFVTIKENPNEQNNIQNLSNDSLYIFLSEINLEKKYYNLMNSNGFEDIQLLIEQEKNCNAVNDAQLKEIGVLLPGDRAKILIHLEEKAEKFSFNVPKNVFYEIIDVENILEDFNVKKIYNWLKNLKVENYLENFLTGGYYSIELILMQMNSKFPINDSILKEELGILKVGHRARIMNKLVEDGKKFWNKLNNNNTIVANTQMEKNCECILI